MNLGKPWLSLILTRTHNTLHQMYVVKKIIFKAYNIPVFMMFDIGNLYICSISNLTNQFSKWTYKHVFFSSNLYLPIQYDSCCLKSCFNLITQTQNVAYLNHKWVSYYNEDIYSSKPNNAHLKSSSRRFCIYFFYLL